MARSPERKIEVLVINQISPVGLARFPAERYSVVKEAKAPDVVLVRSQNLHDFDFGANVKVVARAGAGTNNIPVATLSARGVPVFNAPGANANAVRELVLAAMLIGARNLGPALAFVRSLDPAAAKLDQVIEDGKKQFAGFELPNHTLGLIGLGKIGSLVAETAIRLGMHVLGFDPEITVDAAWSLPSQVRRAASIEEVLKASHIVSLHVPLVEGTRHLINARNVEHARPGMILLNFSREAIVEEQAVLRGLQSHRLRCFVTDFPSAALLGQSGVIALPHLGASTHEAEENSAVMVVDQIRDYLENGGMRNAVNFPDAAMPREVPYRLAIANANVPEMLARMSHALGSRRINIHNMLNKSRGDMAYTLVDADTPVPADAIEELRRIDGVLSVRYLAENARAGGRG